MEEELIIDFFYSIYKDLLNCFVDDWKKCCYNDDDESINHDDTNPWKLLLFDNKFIEVNDFGSCSFENGVKYKGELLNNKVHGRGLLEWNDQCWYEGDFLNTYRHGRGTLFNRKQQLYIGQWFIGLKHGKGYCRYAEGDSYDGDWSNNEKNGYGLRIYKSGSRYNGQWKRNFRDGVGTMSWPNGDFYRGQWANGRMHGYGEYVWNSFFNQTLSWPRETFYTGYWINGKQHGYGLFKLNSVNGQKYSGQWEFGKKHGYGLIVGSNGNILWGDPLFLNDILMTCVTDRTTITKPSHLICLSYHLERLRKNQPSVTLINENLKLEKQAVHDTLFKHLSRLREIYQIYAQLFTKSPPDCHLCMTKLTLHQLYRDCGLHEKYNLVDLDCKIGQNQSTILDETLGPFEKIEFWQFLHVLVEISWHVYTKSLLQDIESCGILSKGLNLFLEIDVYPNYGNHIGLLVTKCMNFFPIDTINEWFDKIQDDCQTLPVKHFLNIVRRLETEDQLKFNETDYHGINCVPMGEKIIYFYEEDFFDQMDQSYFVDKNSHRCLGKLKELDLPFLLKIIIKVCPLISEDGIIIDINYKLTFLEFYEIILETLK